MSIHTISVAPRTLMLCNMTAPKPFTSYPAGLHSGGRLYARILSVCSFAAFVWLLLLCRLQGAEEPQVLPVWPGAVPGDYGTIGPERVRAPSEAPTKNAKWITNVTKPAIAVFRPSKEKNSGTAIVICPGGGYWNLAWDLEGEEVAAWFNALGV